MLQRRHADLLSLHSATCIFHYLDYDTEVMLHIHSCDLKLIFFAFSFYIITHVLPLLSPLSFNRYGTIVEVVFWNKSLIFLNTFFFNFFIFFLKRIYLNWNRITVYYCDGFWHIHQHEPAIWKHVSPIPEHNSNLPCYPMLLSSSTAQELGTSFMHWTCAGHLFYIW